MPEKSWCLRPCLGCDWLAGVASPRARGAGGGPRLLLRLPAPPVGTAALFPTVPPPSGSTFSTASPVSALGTVTGTEMVLTECLLNE